MLNLDVTLSQVIDLVTQLPPDGKRSVLAALGVTQEVDHSAVMSQDDRLVKLQQLFGCWRDQPDLIEIFQGIESDRRSDLGRSVHGW